MSASQYTDAGAELHAIAAELRRRPTPDRLRGIAERLDELGRQLRIEQAAMVAALERTRDAGQ